MHGTFDLLEEFGVGLDEVVKGGGSSISIEDRILEVDGILRVESSILIGCRILEIDGILKVGSSILTVKRILSRIEILIGREV